MALVNLFVISAWRKVVRDLKIICKLFSSILFLLHFFDILLICRYRWHKKPYFYYGVNNKEPIERTIVPLILRYYKLILLLHPSSVSNK